MHIAFLPARFGDSIVIDYQDDNQARRVLIDGGTSGTRHDIRKILEDGLTELELVVVSHIDRDHIEGILKMLEETEPGFSTGDFWFNAWNHLPKGDTETFSAEQGERLSRQLRIRDVPWNKAFGGNAVVIPDSGDLPVVELAGGLTLTLLGPTHQKLADLASKWEDEVLAANLNPGFGLDENDEEIDLDVESFDAVDIPDVAALAATPFEDDDSPANCSSIAFIMEHAGKRVLMPGDADVETLLHGLERFSPGTQVAVDLVKLPHHGSSHNVSRELLEKIDCRRYMFSSNGSIFHHPKPEAVARVIQFVDQPELIFNYRSEENAIWEEGFLQRQHGYTTLYPDAGSAGISVTL